MKQVLAFDDVLLIPTFSYIKSRKDVDTSTTVGDALLEFPVISSNMDSVTDVDMTHAMDKAGGAGCLHRFWSIEDNVAALKKSANNTWVSIGLGDYEMERAIALLDAGATTFVLDVANGGSIDVVTQAKRIQSEFGFAADIIVGNFATKNVLETFIDKVGYKLAGYKIGIGGGSACLTRHVTGCGLPTLASLLDCQPIAEYVDLIADGGIRNSGDLAKALAAGAKAVMCGKILAGTKESPGEVIEEHINALPTGNRFKKYRGSASRESYEVQGKEAPWRAPEGDSFLIPYAGSVQDVIQGLNGGLRSAMSYMNAAGLSELRYNAEFVSITGAGLRENSAHGKGN